MPAGRLWLKQQQLGGFPSQTLPHPVGPFQLPLWGVKGQPVSPECPLCTKSHAGHGTQMSEAKVLEKCPICPRTHNRCSGNPQSAVGVVGLYPMPLLPTPHSLGLPMPKQHRGRVRKAYHFLKPLILY